MVRPSTDPGVFYVESTSKRDTEEQTVNLLEGVCTCHDFTCRVRGNRRANKVFTRPPAKDRTICRHIEEVLIFLGRQVARQMREQNNK